jgi:predicted AlkP superfamily phosphohydrolase/phosphomutase
MKICVLGLDCAAPEILLHDTRLVHVRRLMNRGLYGKLESVVPPITVPAWMCMVTGQDPGSLGVYGFRNRVDYSYVGLSFVNSNSIRQPAIWDVLATYGKKSIVVGVPPSYPPRRIHGISVGCFLTPDPSKNEFTHPSGIGVKLHELTGGYPVDVKNFRTTDKDRLKREIFEMSRKQWTAVRWLLTEQEWDYFHFVDIGLDRIQHGFWNYYDPQHRHYQPGNPNPA